MTYHLFVHVGIAQQPALQIIPTVPLSKAVPGSYSDASHELDVLAGPLMHSEVLVLFSDHTFYTFTIGGMPIWMEDTGSWSYSDGVVHTRSDHRSLLAKKHSVEQYYTFCAIKDDKKQALRLLPKSSGYFRRGKLILNEPWHSDVDLLMGVLTRSVYGYESKAKRKSLYETWLKETNKAERKIRTK